MRAHATPASEFITQVRLRKKTSPTCVGCSLVLTCLSLASCCLSITSGVSKDEIRYEFDGQCSFFSTMWTGNKFERDPLSMPFLMRVLYIYQKDKASNQWNTDTQMQIKDLDVTASRRQFIMLQNILDNQMSDIRDVSSMVRAHFVVTFSGLNVLNVLCLLVCLFVSI